MALLTLSLNTTATLLFISVRISYFAGSKRESFCPISSSGLSRHWAEVFLRLNLNSFQLFLIIERTGLGVCPIFFVTFASMMRSNKNGLIKNEKI